MTLRGNDIKYPEDSSSGFEGMTIYWNSPKSRFPDFNSEGHLDKKWWDCGRIDGREDGNNDAVYTGTDAVTSAATTAIVSGRVSVAGRDADNEPVSTATSTVTSTEGLCLYISSDNSITSSEQNYRVTYSYNAVVQVSFDPTGSAAAYNGQLQVGSNFSVETIVDKNNGGIRQVFSNRDSSLVPTDGTGLINDDVPLVTVEEVGKYRYWDVNIDGYPERTYNSRTVNDDDVTVSIVSTFETHECETWTLRPGNWRMSVLQWLHRHCMQFAECN